MLLTINSVAPVYIFSNVGFVLKFNCRSMERSLGTKIILFSRQILYYAYYIYLVYLVFVTRQVKSKASPMRTVFFASITVKRISPYSIACEIKYKLFSKLVSAQNHGLNHVNTNTSFQLARL